MFNEFLYILSPYLFHVYNNPHKFMNILLSICEVLIGHNQFFIFLVSIIVINMRLVASSIHILLFHFCSHYEYQCN
jgi:hypothetical protein